MNVESRPLAWEYAGTGRRFGAQVVDNLVGTLVLSVPYAVLVVGLLNESAALALTGLGLVMLVPVVYAVVVIRWQGKAGLTPGKKALSLQTVDAATGGPIGFGRAFLRQLVLGLLGPLNVIQLFVIGSHPHHQGWHDRAARSVVLDRRREATGAAAPQMPTAPPPPSLASRVSGSGSTAPGSFPPAGPPVIPPSAPPAPAAPSTSGVTAAAPAPLVVPPPPGMVAPPPGLGTPAPPAQPPAQPPAVPPAPAVADDLVVRAWRVVAADGSSREIAGDVLVGRDPTGSLVPEASTWSVVDPALSVSKTHALLGAGPDGAWVEDWHSTNGVRLRRDGLTTALAPHSRTSLHDGDQVLLGDFVLTIEVPR